ncbi:MAG: hypothetical protein DRQ55_05160 [Planctomycetota bacterium]|nr:MAG: hypothetical protein DRQ55_05160 [Planctomycetota bacterium]
MSPEDTRARAGAGFAAATEAFFASLASTIEQLRAMLPAGAAVDNDAADPAPLGNFALGRIDPARFASLVLRERALDPDASGAMERALATLSGLARQGEQLTSVKLAPGESLHAAVSAALAQVGRAFGAARVAALARSDQYEPARHDRDLERFPFARWNRAERRLAPPLLIELDGADLHAGALAEFLDGQMRFVFVLRGEASPAPLAGLVSPGVFVAQAADAESLERMFAWGGPGLAALVPEPCARFVHDPEGGLQSFERLTLEHLPEQAPAGSVGGISRAQQSAQLRQLQDLAAPVTPAVSAPPAPVAARPSAPDAIAAAPRPATPDEIAAASAATPPTPDPIDKLAAWLLAAADLSDLP